MKKVLLSFMVLTALSACSSGEYSDLKTWMKDQEKGMRGKIDSLPDAKTYVPVGFTAKDNPFVVKPSISLSDLAKNKYAPDPNRRKEPLEEFPSESLKMVGTVFKDKKPFAMIRDKNRLIHYVTVGNYIGTNYGQIIEVNEGEIVINERIKEDDEWKIKPARIFLTESEK